MKRITFILCLIMALFSSCKKSGDGLSFLPVSSGRPYEILVVIDKAMYERPAGRVLHEKEPPLADDTAGGRVHP